MLIDLTVPHTDVWRAFRFPDGQPHIEINHLDSAVDLRCRITNAEELMQVLLVADMCHREQPSWELNLHIAYLMAARMDRPMPSEEMNQPFTLKVVADLLATGNFTRITIFDPHSDVAPALLNAEAILPYDQVLEASQNVDLFIIPDAGAMKRVSELAAYCGMPTTQALKHRDMATGKLSETMLAFPSVVKNQRCLIVDDICDGGRTFTALAAKLRDAGASSVDLYVSHGIFSAGYMLTGIDHIYTTHSYRDYTSSVIAAHMTAMYWWQ